ncbi:unnamed protein product [Arctogadus glacialis]
MPTVGVSLDYVDTLNESHRLPVLKATRSPSTGLHVFFQEHQPDIYCGDLAPWIMAQTNSVGQGTNGVADESPNMIVYRKTHLGRDYFSRLVWLISPGASSTPSFPRGFSLSSSVSELFCSVCAASAQREQRSPGVGVLSFGGNR